MIDKPDYTVFGLLIIDFINAIMNESITSSDPTIIFDDWDDIEEYLHVLATFR